MALPEAKVLVANQGHGRPPLFLGQQNRCLFTGDQDAYARLAHTPTNVDHLVPKKAAKEHGRLLRSVLEREENKVCLCMGCHRRRDHHPRLGKMIIYRRHGLPGLIQDLALYPRATAHELYVLQYHQWRELFNLLWNGLNSAIKAERVPKFAMSDYTSSRDIVEYYLDQWAMGNFDIRMSALALLLKEE